MSTLCQNNKYSRTKNTTLSYFYGRLILAFPRASSLHGNRHQCHNSQRDQLRQTEELRRDPGQIPESGDVPASSRATRQSTRKGAGKLTKRPEASGERARKTEHEQVRDAALAGRVVAGAAYGRALREGTEPVPVPARVLQVHRRAVPETPPLEHREQGDRCEGRRGRREICEAAGILLPSNSVTRARKRIYRRRSW